MGRLGIGIYAAAQAGARGSILSCCSVVLADNFRLWERAAKSSWAPVPEEVYKRERLVTKNMAGNQVLDLQHKVKGKLQWGPTKACKELDRPRFWARVGPDWILRKPIYISRLLKSLRTIINSLGGSVENHSSWARGHLAAVQDKLRKAGTKNEIGCSHFRGTWIFFCPLEVEERSCSCEESSCNSAWGLEVRKTVILQINKLKVGKF